MSERDEEQQHREGEPYQVIISDLRHSREISEAEDAEPEAQERGEKAEPAAEAAQADAPLKTPDMTVAAREAETLAPEIVQAADSQAQLEEFEAEQPGDEVSAGEMAYLRQVFAAGLNNYLKSQLGLLLNFALLALGRAPDPATGLVSKNLPHARLAIDTLEFIVARLEPELQQAEKVQMKALISDLKFAYMQAVGPAQPPAAGTPQ